MKLFSKKRSEKLVGIIDIGNGSIGASLVRLNAAGLPELLSGGRRELPVPDTRSSDLLFSQVLKELPTALKELSGSPEHLLFIVSSPWIHVSSIRTLRFSRATPILVTETLLERMLVDETRLSKSQSEGYVPIERTIVGLRLNGYPVTALPSSPVQVAEVTFFTSAAPQNALQNLTDVASSVLPHVPVTFHSAPLSAYYGLARLFPSTLSHIFINVTGEVTELLHVENGTPSAFGTFPIGRNMLLRTLQAAGMPPHEALSALELARMEESPMRKKLEETLAHVQLEWRRGLREALSALVPTGGFPQNLFVTADIRVATWFGDVVRSEEFLAISRGIPPIVDILSLQEFSSEIRLSGGTPDPLVLLATLFADARFDEGRTIDLLSTKNPVGMPIRATLHA